MAPTGMPAKFKIKNGDGYSKRGGATNDHYVLKYITIKHTTGSEG